MNKLFRISILVLALMGGFSVLTFYTYDESSDADFSISFNEKYGIYALNIIDANVDAHLMQYNIDENLSLAPHYKINEIDAKGDVGLTLNFKF